MAVRIAGGGNRNKGNQSDAGEDDMDDDDRTEHNGAKIKRRTTEKRAKKAKRRKRRSRATGSPSIDAEETTTFVYRFDFKLRQ
jgi:hypothetical protein